MFNLTRLIHLAPGEEPHALIPALRAIADASVAAHVLIEPTLPGVRNGGDILMHLRFSDLQGRTETAAQLDEALDSSAVEHVDGAEYRGAAHKTAGEQPATVYRTLLLRVAPDTDETLIERFESDLALMPHYVRTITAWQLSRVERAVGASSWTHVFEQHFTDVDGLMGPYLMHPIHWAHVDRWFDPECPDVIVWDRVCHSFCRSDTAVLG
ncbi:MAG: Dabb family protein [Mycobacteriaceae bacterium]|nr:Dabb family protein [Mycobacteriaceae bacterium]